MTATIAARVADGVQLLDEHVPGWVDRIDVDRLDVSHPGNCPLGQLFGAYLRAWRALFPGDEIPSEFPASVGFDAYDGPDVWDEIIELNDEWRFRIRARRAQDVAEEVQPTPWGGQAGCTSPGAARADLSAADAAAGCSTLIGASA